MASLYFIQNSQTGIVKIGVSENVDRRRDALEFAGGTRLVVRRVVTGGAAYEPRLHAAFRASRRVGEWFDLTPELELLMDGDEWIGAFLRRHADLVAQNLAIAATERSQQARGRTLERSAERFARIGQELDDLFGPLPGLIPGPVGTLSGEIEDDSPIVTRAGLEPATYGLKGPRPIAGDTSTHPVTTASETVTSGDDRRSAPENESKSPEMSPDGAEVAEPPSLASQRQATPDSYAHFTWCAFILDRAAACSCRPSTSAIEGFKGGNRMSWAPSADRFHLSHCPVLTQQMPMSQCICAQGEVRS